MHPSLYEDAKRQNNDKFKSYHFVKNIFKASNFFMQMFNISTLCRNSIRLPSVKALVQVEIYKNFLSAQDPHEDANKSVNQRTNGPESAHVAPGLGTYHMEKLLNMEPG